MGSDLLDKVACAQSSDEMARERIICVWCDWTESEGGFPTITRHSFVYISLNLSARNMLRLRRPSDANHGRYASTYLVGGVDCNKS